MDTLARQRVAPLCSVRCIDPLLRLRASNADARPIDPAAAKKRGRARGARGGDA